MLNQENEEDGNDKCTLFKVSPQAADQAPFVELMRKAGHVGASDKLYLSGDLHRVFDLFTYFPDPNNDFLLYLTLAGSTACPGLIVNDSSGNPVRVTVANLVKTALPANHSIPSINAKMPHWGIHEMIVCAAFMTACNSGPLRGISLEELVTRFVAELVDADKYVPLKTVAQIEWVGSSEWKGQFMWPYDTELPSDVDALFNTVNSTRPGRGALRMDGYSTRGPTQDLVDHKTRSKFLWRLSRPRSLRQ